MKARAKHRTFFNMHVQPNICVLESVSFTPSELDQLCPSETNRDSEEAFWNQFRAADTVGSLIQPATNLIQPLKRHVDNSEPIDGDLISGRLFESARRVLLQAEYLSSRYHVVVANPPYMGSRNMSPEIADWLKRNYPTASSDLFASFFYRCLQLAINDGQLGFMSPFVWMFVSTYRPLRERLVIDETITSLIQLEYSGFEGATVPVCTFTLQKGPSNFRGGFVRLKDFVGAAQQGPRALEIIRAGVAREKGTPNDFPGKERHFYRTSATGFAQLPTFAIAYWISPRVRDLFQANRSMADIAEFTGSLHKTGNNATYVRKSWEVSARKIGPDRRWVSYTKGGGQRRWYGLVTDVVDWSPLAHDFYRNNSGSSMLTEERWYRDGITYSMITSGTNTFRQLPPGAVYDMGGPTFHPLTGHSELALGVANSSVTPPILELLNPTLNLQTSDVKRLPVPALSPDDHDELRTAVNLCVDLSQRDWDSQEISTGFQRSELVQACEPLVEAAVEAVLSTGDFRVTTLAQSEQRINEIVAAGFGLEDELETAVDEASVTAFSNPSYRVRVGGPDGRSLLANQLVVDLMAYSVGCMFGRFSLEEPGLILANQGDTLHNYLEKVSDPRFLPDQDNVIPVVGGDWFEDDIVGQFRQFLRAAFGDEHFEENLRFVTESLGVKNLRDYFVKSFYKDHVNRYKKRPIYWMFSSPKGSFNALIYMHRYTPSTVSTVLNEYLREFQAKLKASLEHAERSNNAKEADRLRKVLLELDEYEHDVLYPLASQNIAIDLDDGVKANYPKFGTALKPIPGVST